MPARSQFDRLVGRFGQLSWIGTRWISIPDGRVLADSRSLPREARACPTERHETRLSEIPLTQPRMPCACHIATGLRSGPDLPSMVAIIKTIAGIWHSPPSAPLTPKASFHYAFGQNDRIEQPHEDTEHMNSGSLRTLRISWSRARVQTLSESPSRFDQTVASGQVGPLARMQRATDIA